MEPPTLMKATPVPRQRQRSRVRGLIRQRAANSGGARICLRIEGLTSVMQELRLKSPDLRTAA